jgi:4-oxalocrotonate tautomerase
MTMPIVTIKTMHGALTEEMKSEMHKKLCRVMVETEGRGREEFAKYVTVIIEEQKPENFSVAGKMANAEFVRKIASA